MTDIWQPIETAPKDGTRVIVLGPECYWNRENQWVPDGRIYACISHWTIKPNGKGYWKFGAPGYSGEIRPTLWAALPESVAQAFEVFDRGML